MRPPIIINHASDLPALLRADRLALGMTGEALDYRVGWSDRYAAKVEAPDKNWGKKVFHEGSSWPDGFHMDRCADEWLIALGRSLVLMDSHEAAKLIADTPNPPNTSPPAVRMLRFVKFTRW